MKNSFSKKVAIVFGWEKFKENAPFLIGVFLIMGAVSFLFDAANKLEISAFMLFIVGVLGFVISTILQMGVTRIVLNIHDGREVSFNNLIGETSLLVKFILAQILTMIAVFAGLILFIVPGIIAAIGLFFVPYVVIDKKLGPIEAIKESWRLTKGHKWNVFFFSLLFVLINLLGMLAFMVGLLVTMPITFLAAVYAYRWLDKQDTPVVQTETATVKEDESR